MGSFDLLKKEVISLVVAGVKRNEVCRKLGIDLEKIASEFAYYSGRRISELSEGSKNTLFTQTVAFWEKGFPNLLREIVDPPLVLFAEGDLSILNRRCVSVVGSRKMSDRGRRAVRQIVPGLVKVGRVVVSGLALGTDAFVHETCLFYGGKTVAVLPSSLKDIRPISNRGLAQRIIRQGGCLVSEYPLGVEIRKENFLERNRIVAGLAEAVIVTEAGKYSGSISTPNFALDQGREVFCYPANKGEENAEGILALIADGASVWNRPN